MHTEQLPAGSIAAIATVVAALIASAISFVNLILNKEQKTSEFRQAWIDALREDLATFFASTRAFARATQEAQAFKDRSEAHAPFAMTEQKISDLRYQVAETRYRIQLRLNPKEGEHIELLRLMQGAITKLQEALHGSSSTENALKAVETAAAYAPQILKSEWERVKKGELPFRLARNWVAPLIFISSLIFIFLLWTGRVKI
ncbi:MAG: hypothetical protein JWP96_1612 [Polaromonas sp.]|nr:hypothetical protein [Polaromonas sp.]